jgi:hypothetical protein
VVQRVVAVEQGLEVVVGGLELADELAVFREHACPLLVVCRIEAVSRKVAYPVARDPLQA